ncbi:T33 [Tupaiid betaherpesvirus 1]|uniref:T33 n=1 Tax=Tupaiid herpesvirus 1 (strain 1) TaxID=10397 RepID=Q91TQ9_TUHV1|nr:T33 [Tupaiid betaherpesvirus 1]AAK57078.1 T33 [Tupaiid betaherpesvirus 1]
MDVLLARDEYVGDDSFLHVNDSCVPSDGLRLARITETCINLLVISVGLPLNLLVFVVQVLANRVNPFSTPALYMTNLCLANLLTVGVLPFLILSNWGYLSGTAGGCKFASLLYYTSCTVGFATVALISVDRYRVIHRRKQNSSRRIYHRTYLILGLTWFIAMCCSAPAPIYTTVLAHDDLPIGARGHETCIIFFAHDLVKPVLGTFKVLLCLVWGLAPVTMMTWFYLVFYRTLRQVSYRKRSRTLMFICILLLCFLLLQTPFVAVMAFDSYALLSWDVECENTNYRDAVSVIARVVPNLHCLANPVLYAFLGNDFLKKFGQFRRGELFSRKAFAQARQANPSAASQHATVGAHRQTIRRGQHLIE